MKVDRIRTARPSPSMAVAIAALFVALGGTAWAVATVGPEDIEGDAVRARHIAANSVHTSQIDNEGVVSADVRDGQVASRDIRNATVRGADVATGSLTGGEIAEGSLAGADLAPGVVGMQQVRRFNAFSAFGSESLKTVTASCPVGEVATGGGGEIALGFRDVAVSASGPVLANKENPPVGWKVSAIEVNPTDIAWRLDAFVVCGRPSAP